MSCAGECKKQVHRFSGGTTTIKIATIGCSDLSDDEAAAVLKDKFGSEDPDTKLEGCTDTGCDCIRRARDTEVWSKPVRHAIPNPFTHFKVFPGPPPRRCGYTFSGTYEVSSSIYVGNCMRKASEKPIIAVVQIVKPVRKKTPKKKGAKKKAKA